MQFMLELIHNFQNFDFLAYSSEFTVVNKGFMVFMVKYFIKDHLFTTDLVYYSFIID
jgi:hypothetical protein